MKCSCKYEGRLSGSRDAQDTGGNKPSSKCEAHRVQSKSWRACLPLTATKFHTFRCCCFPSLIFGACVEMWGWDAPLQNIMTWSGLLQPNRLRPRPASNNLQGIEYWLLVISSCSKKSWYFSALNRHTMLWPVPPFTSEVVNAFDNRSFVVGQSQRVFSQQDSESPPHNHPFFVKSQPLSFRMVNFHDLVVLSLSVRPNAPLLGSESSQPRRSFGIRHFRSLLITHPRTRCI